MSHNSTLSVVLALAMLLFSGCKTPEPKPEPKPVPERVPEKPKKQSFVAPTAEQAYGNDQ
jgi:PBP1b-binding outer membrane lipoprotein LpoB